MNVIVFYALLLPTVPVNSHGNVGTVASDFVGLLPDIEVISKFCN